MLLKIRNFSSFHPTYWNNFTFMLVQSYFFHLVWSQIFQVPLFFSGIGRSRACYQGHSALHGTMSEKLEVLCTTQAGSDLFDSINRIPPSPLFEKPRKRTVRKGVVTANNAFCPHAELIKSHSDVTGEILDLRWLPVYTNCHVDSSKIWSSQYSEIFSFPCNRRLALKDYNFETRKTSTSMHNYNSGVQVMTWTVVQEIQ